MRALFSDGTAALHCEFLSGGRAPGLALSGDMADKRVCAQAPRAVLQEACCHKRSLTRSELLPPAGRFGAWEQPLSAQLQLRPPRCSCRRGRDPVPCRCRRLGPDQGDPLPFRSALTKIARALRKAMPGLSAVGGVWRAGSYPCAEKIEL